MPYSINIIAPPHIRTGPESSAVPCAGAAPFAISWTAPIRAWLCTATGASKAGAIFNWCLGINCFLLGTRRFGLILAAEHPCGDDFGERKGTFSLLHS